MITSNKKKFRKGCNKVGTAGRRKQTIWFRNKAGKLISKVITHRFK